MSQRRNSSSEEGGRTSSSSRITEFPARVQFVGDKTVGNIEKGTAMRHTTQHGLSHYEVHLDRGGNILLHEDEVTRAHDDE
jgi:hypothetical protein